MSRHKTPRNERADAKAIASECVGARIRMLNRAVTRMYDERLRPLGVKFSQLNILTVVTVRGPVQPGEIARILFLEKSTVSRNVAILEANGWIESSAGESGNSRLLQTTREGRRLLGTARPAWQEAQDLVTDLLGKRTTADLLRAAKRMRASEAS